MSPEQIAIAQNVTNNGRWFSALVAVVNLMTGHPVLALAAALPIGLAVVADMLQLHDSDHPAAPFIGLGNIVLAALVFILSLVVAW